MIGPFQRVSNVDALFTQTTGPPFAVLVCSKKVIGYNSSEFEFIEHTQCHFVSGTIVFSVTVSNCNSQ